MAGRKVLYVAESKLYSQVVTGVAEKYDIDLYRASSGERALQQLKSGKIPPLHLVISDYTLPGMNGVRFLREVESHYCDSHNRPKLTLMAENPEAARTEMDGEGIGGVVERIMGKPFSIKELRELLESIGASLKGRGSW